MFLVLDLLIQRSVYQIVKWVSEICYNPMIGDTYFMDVSANILQYLRIFRQKQTIPN